MKKGKRLLAVILVAMLTGTAFVGCKSNQEQGNSSGGSGSKGDSGETVKLRYYLSDTTGTDDAKVADAINEIIRPKINAEIEIVKYGAGDYSQKLPLAIASNEKMDICFDAGWMDYVNRAKSNAYYDISEKVETLTPDLYKTVDPLLWQGVTINGGIYGVPTYKELAEQWALYAETDFLKEKNIDASKITKIEDAEVILEALQDTDRAGFQVVPGKDVSCLSKLAEFDQVGADRSGLSVVDKKEGKTIVNYYETENYKNFVHLMRDWYNKGYIDKNVVTREDYDEYTKDSHRYGLGYVSYSPLNEVVQATTYGKELTPMPVTPITTTNSSTTGSVTCILAKSENPEKALEFLEIANTDGAVKDLLCFGIKDLHYTLEDGKVKVADGVQEMWCSQNWTTGNMFISSLLVGEPDDKYDQYLAFNDKATAAVTLGFQPDTSKIDDKMAACTSVVKEYANLLEVGAVDPDEQLPKFIDALKAAGSDDIIAEFQAQYDEWLKTK